MTIVPVPPFALYQDELVIPNSFNGNTIDANDEQSGHLFQAPKTGSIDRICFRVGAFTSSDTVTAGLQSIDATGLPNGTFLASNTRLVNVQNTWHEVILGSAVAVTKGDWLALVVALPATGSTGNFAVSRSSLNSGGTISRPYTTSKAGGPPPTWTKVTSNIGVGAIRYTDGTYPPTFGLTPIFSISNHSWTNTANPEEYGNRIKIQFDCRVSGIWSLSSSNNAGDFILRLYDVNDTVLGSISVDGDLASQLTTEPPGWQFFTSDVILRAGSTVRVTKTPTTTTAASQISSGLGVSGASSLGDADTVCYQTTRHATGAWNDSVQVIEGIGLIINGLEDYAAETRAYAT